MGKRGPKIKQPLKKKYDLIVPEGKGKDGTKEGTDVFEIIALAVSEHRPELSFARIGAAWMIGKKRDRDGHVILGRMKLCNELEQQQLGLDRIVLLNQEVWRAFDRKQRIALSHHELCHMAPVFESDGVAQAVNGHGDRRWRKVRHDLEEFRAVVEAHGCYLDDLRQFGHALLTASPQLRLPTDVPPAEPPVSAKSRRGAQPVAAESGPH